mgnify:CR=1 FL=1
MIEDVLLIDPEAFLDERGWFSESYRKTSLMKHGVTQFSQVNRSFSINKGTIRGLHLQEKPHSQGKLVQCIMGSIFDVAVDVRRSSPTFGKWVSYTLNRENRRSLWIPEGFAHGFQTLEDNTEVLYLTTREYSPEHDRSILWSDPEIGIKWPLSHTPVLSEKDSQAPLLNELVGR